MYKSKLQKYLIECDAMQHNGMECKRFNYIKNVYCTRVHVTMFPYLFFCLLKGILATSQEYSFAGKS